MRGPRPTRCRPSGSTAPNFYGVRDVHGVVWEWVLDLGSMMVSADNREQGDPDLKRFCGTGALTMEQKDNYAMLMRIATLSSMQANYTSSIDGIPLRGRPGARPMKRLADVADARRCVPGRRTPRAPMPTASIYQLDATLTDQAGRAHGLDMYRGHPVLITMFYASCPAACPLIIDTLRATEKDLTAAQRADLRVLMISIDPERDTVAALRSLAEQRRIDTTRWTLARADSVRRAHHCRAAQCAVPATAERRVQSFERHHPAVAAG